MQGQYTHTCIDYSQTDEPLEKPQVELKKSLK